MAVSEITLDEQIEIIESLPLGETILDVFGDDSELLVQRARTLLTGVNLVRLNRSGDYGKGAVVLLDLELEDETSSMELVVGGVGRYKSSADLGLLKFKSFRPPLGEWQAVGKVGGYVLGRRLHKMEPIE